MSEYKYATLAVHAGQEPDPLTGAVNVPVYLSSTFELTGIGTDKGWDYSRAGNPTRDRLEAALAAWKAVTSGHAFASGMAAIYALVATLHAGDHLICSHNVYGGTARLFNLIVRHYGIEIEYVDTGNLDAVARGDQGRNQADSYRDADQSADGADRHCGCERIGACEAAWK